MIVRCGRASSLLRRMKSLLSQFLLEKRVLIWHETSTSLSQIDRLYDWKKSPDTDVVATLKKQKKNTKDEFDERAKAVMLEFAQQVCPHSMPSMLRLYLKTLRRSFTGIL